MKKNNIINLIFIFIILFPILDASVVLTTLPISTIIRGLFLIFSVTYLVKNKHNLKIIGFLSLLIVFLSIYLFTINYSIYEIITSVFKLFYLPFTCLLFMNLDYDKKINKSLIISLIIYISIYLLSYIFNFGYNNYLEEEGKIGFRGVFNSINELSAILVILYYYAYNFLKDKKVTLIIITILMLIISYLTGTKVLLGGILLTIFINIFPVIFNKFKKSSAKNRLIIIISGILTITLLGYLFTLTNTYYNMKIQGEFFKVTNVFSYEFLNRVLFNDRLTFLNTNLDIYLNSDILSKIFGLGTSKFPKLVEIDIFDIWFTYGIIGLLLILSIFTYILKLVKFNKYNLFGIIILIMISLTSGHVLLSPAVSIFFGIIIYLNKQNLLRKNEKI